MIAGLSNASQFASCVGISYENLTDILRTHFVNPDSALIPKLERLGVSFATLTALKAGTITDADFDKLLAAQAAPPNPIEFGGDIKVWVKDNANHARIMGLIVLATPTTLWAAAKTYIDGDCVVPTASPAISTLYYEATTAGTSAAAEPTWPSTPGTTCPDGTVVWTCRDLSSCLAFDNFAFRYADPAKAAQNIRADVFIRLMRFIRLWKNCGWTIGQTDAAICALYRKDFAPPSAVDLGDALSIDAGFLTLLPRIGVINRVMTAMELTAQRDLLSLLTCWSDIGTHGNDALYRRMFLDPVLLTQDPAFGDNGYGEFLQDPLQTILTAGSLKKAQVAGSITVGDQFTTTIDGVDIPYTVAASDTNVTILAMHIAAAVNATTTADPVSGQPLNQAVLATSQSGVVTIEAQGAVRPIALACGVSPGATETYTTLDHEPVLRAALNLTGDEFVMIAQALGFDDATPLNVANVSAIFRRGWLARRLKISVRELLLLIELTGLDVFGMPDPGNPQILRLLSLVQALRDSPLKTSAALYLIWNQDFGGKSAPEPADIKEFVRTLRAEFAEVDDQFTAIEDPSGDVARVRMALVYGQQTADALFALLDETLVLDVPYTHSAPALEAAITDTDSRIAYDAFRHQLSHTGLVSSTMQTALKSLGGVSGNFRDAVDALFARSEAIEGLFFTRYPEVKPAYDLAAAKPPAERHGAFLGAFQPELARRRKRQQAVQRLSAAAGVEADFAQRMLDPDGKPGPIHATGNKSAPALNDVIALETSGLEARFYFRDTATGNPDQTDTAVASLDYAGGGSNPLPHAGNAISGIWTGQVEAPDAGYYNFVVEADIGATVTIGFRGNALALTQNGNAWRNSGPIELKGGTLYEISLTVEKVKNKVSLTWETPKRTRDAIPPRCLFPPAILGPFSSVYVRFLKAASLATALRLTTNEFAHFASHPDYQITADEWLNALSVSGIPSPGTAAALLKPLESLLAFARIKSEISPGDESLLTILEDPASATSTQKGLLFCITGWTSGFLQRGARPSPRQRRATRAFRSVPKTARSVHTRPESWPVVTISDPGDDQRANEQYRTRPAGGAARALRRGRLAGRHPSHQRRDA